MINAQEVNRKRLKRLAPRSWFTKKGPGVHAKMQRWFQQLDTIDRMFVLDLGWVPRAWAALPFIPPDAEMATIQPMAESKPTIIEKAANLGRKIFGGIRRLFRGGDR